MSMRTIQRVKQAPVVRSGPAVQGIPRGRARARGLPSPSFGVPGVRAETLPRQREAIVDASQERFEREANAVAEQAGSEVAIASDALAAPRAGGLSGAPLPATFRSYFEPRFGHDFSRVQLHADGAAARSARALGARAFTVGESISFGAGEYRPGTQAGLKLLAHELAHVVQQRTAGPRVQRQTFEDPSEAFGPQFTCNAAQMIDAVGDTSVSCCTEGPLQTIRGMARTAQQNLDRAITRIASGRRMDAAIARHFGAAQVGRRSTILENLRQVRTTLVGFEANGKVYGCRGADSACDAETEAAANGDGMYFCNVGPNPPYVTQPWTTLLHEMFHVAFPGSLPSFSEATPAQQAAGEFETYFSEHGQESSDPRLSRYATTAYSLRTADSYAQLVAVIGAESWAEEPAPAGAYFPMATVSAGALLPSGELTFAARVTHTPYGLGFLFVTAGATGIWTPGRTPVLSSDPHARDTAGYVGADLGLRAIAGGGTVTGVFDLSGGVGARFTRGTGADAAAHARISAGLRIGTASAGVSLGADLQRVFDFATTTRADEGWILGGFVSGHWGGHSGQTR